MRLILWLPILLVVLGAGAIYAAYGEIDPCRVYAVERARRAETAVGFATGGMMERWSRLETSQLSTGQCAGGLAQSWRERIEDWRAGP